MAHTTQRWLGRLGRMLLLVAGLVAVGGLWGLGDGGGAAGRVAAAPLTPFPTATCPPEGWTALGAYPRYVSESAAAVLDNRLVVFGGWGSSNPVQDAYRYSLASGRWTAIHPLPEPRAALAAAADDSRIFVQGGTSTTGYEATLWAWNPNTDNYQWLAPAPVGTAFHALVHLNGKLYRIGGGTGSPRGWVYRAAVDVYDTGTNTWTQAAPYPAAAMGIMAVAQDGYIYAGGGYNGIYIAKTYRYNPATNSWSDSAIRDLPAGRAYGATAVLNGDWLIAGGNAPTISPSTLTLDLSTSASVWHYGGGLPTGRSEWAGGVLGRNFYGVGGKLANGDSVSNDTLRYSDGCP